MDAKEWKTGDTCYVLTNKKKRQSAEYTVLSFDGKHYFLESREGEPYQCLPFPDVPVKGRSIRFAWIGGHDTENSVGTAKIKRNSWKIKTGGRQSSGSSSSLPYIRSESGFYQENFEP